VLAPLFVQDHRRKKGLRQGRMLPGSSFVLHLCVRENLNPSSQLFFACPGKRSGPPIDTASMSIPSDSQVYYHGTRTAPGVMMVSYKHGMFLMGALFSLIDITLAP
jgi:hypothetical protein